MGPPPQGWADAPPYHYHGTTQPLPQTAPLGEGAGAPAEPRSLWIGGLKHWMNEDYLCSCFTESPELVSLVIRRNKQSGQSEGFGFLKFTDHATADLVLGSYNGQDMPNTDQDFKLNWATQQPAPEKRPDQDFKLNWATQHPAPEKCPDQDFKLSWGTQQGAQAQRHTGDGSNHAIFVGDLASDVTDFMLHHLFKTRYPSVKGAKLSLTGLLVAQKAMALFPLEMSTSTHKQ